jgi:integrase
VRGSIRQNGAKGWQVRVSLGRDPETGRYRYAYRQVQGGKREAQRVAAELVSEVDRGGHRHTGRHSVGELLDRWMIHLEGQGRAPSTLTRYRSAIHANIKPRLGNVPINKLQAADLDSFYASLAKTGLSPLSVRKSHAILSAAFNQALKWGWVDRNPVDQASPPTTRGREIHPPAPDELRRLLEACLDVQPDLGSLIYTAATTGARRGELCGLRWSDLDLDAGTLTIARSISDAGTEVSVKDTKTHQARRIALDSSTVRVLRQQREASEQRADAAGVTLTQSAYVWSQDLDSVTPYRPDRVTGAFRSLRDRLELPHITFHALRHFSATVLAGQGVGVRTIAGRMGHANPSVTLRTYAHLLDASDRDAADAIGEVVASIHPASSQRASASSSARRGTTNRRPSRTDGNSRRATKS